jgi:hypothetical protein
MKRQDNSVGHCSVVWSLSLPLIFLFDYLLLCCCCIICCMHYCVVVCIVLYVLYMGFALYIRVVAIKQAEQSEVSDRTTGVEG